MSAEPERIQAVFLLVVEAADADQRAEVLDRECGADGELRQRVEALLQAHDASEGFVDRPIVSTPSTVDEPRLLEGPGTRIGNYKLLQQIGEGGMGVVFLAEQIEPVLRKVALKVIKPGMDTHQVVARFEAERQALALMDHPNIAKVLDAGATDTGRPFFVMELVKGLPITKYCDQEHLTPRERLQLFLPICQAVQHAHQKGIIHRDLKPSNILIGLYDGRPVPKVIDFGVAKATGIKLIDRTLFTEVGHAIGTWEYMAPEQAEFNNLDIDTRADIYALGATLYELLAGSPPFTSQQLRQAAFEEMLRMIREVEPPAPSTKLSSSDELPSLAARRKLEPAKLSRLIRGDLDWIVMKCLEKERGRRYETANGLARDVQRYLCDEAVEASPPSTTYRLRKFVRRHKGPLLAAACILLALVVGVIGTSWGLIRAEQAKQAEAERATGEEKAKLEALNAAALAQQRLRHIEKGNEILTSVFTDLDPQAEEKEGRQLRLILGDRLMKAAEQLEGETIGDPVLVAGLQDRLGLSLLHLGMAERAIPLFVKARATRAARLGADHLDTLTSMSNLANGYQDAGKLDQALSLYGETFELCKATLGLAQHKTLVAMHDLGTGYLTVGQLNRALPLLEESFQRMERVLGSQDEETLNAMNSLALAYRAAGKLDQALALYEKAFEVRKATRGAGHQYTLTSMTNLASTCRVAGKFARAQELLEEALKLSQASLGADHPDTLYVMNSLATLYQEISRLDLALPLFEQTLKLRRAKLGSDHPSTIVSINNLAQGYAKSGKLDRALPLYEEAAAAIEKREFRHEFAEGIVYNNLVPCLEQLRQFDRAEVWRRKWLAVIRERSGAESLPYVRALGGLGLNLLQQKKWTDAETVLRDSLALRKKKMPDDWTIFNTQSMLGAALVGQKNYALAEPLLLAGYEGMKQREAKIPAANKPRLTEAINRLVQLYDASGRKDNADAWRKKLEAKAR
jgi:non-specific serine/threonine protein kinase/serine/threonine-protein kinase